MDIAKEGEGLEQGLFIKDKEGNIFRAGFSYSLDMTDPTAEELSPSTVDWTADAVTVRLSASDGTSGIASVTLEKPDGSEQPLTGDGSYSFEAGVNGDYTVTVTDRAGNSTKRSINIGNLDSSTPALKVLGGRAERREPEPDRHGAEKWRFRGHRHGEQKRRRPAGDS